MKNKIIHLSGSLISWYEELKITVSIQLGEREVSSFDLLQMNLMTFYKIDTSHEYDFLKTLEKAAKYNWTHEKFTEEIHQKILNSECQT